MYKFNEHKTHENFSFWSLLSEEWRDVNDVLRRTHTYDTLLQIRIRAILNLRKEENE